MDVESGEDCEKKGRFRDSQEGFCGLTAKWIVGSVPFLLVIIVTLLIFEAQEMAELEKAQQEKERVRDRFLNMHAVVAANHTIDPFLEQLRSIPEPFNGTAEYHEEPPPPVPSPSPPRQVGAEYRVVLPDRAMPPPPPPEKFLGGRVRTTEEGQQIVESELFPLNRTTWEPIDNTARRQQERYAAQMISPPSPPLLPPYPPLAAGHVFDRMAKDAKKDLPKFVNLIPATAGCFSSGSGSNPDAAKQVPILTESHHPQSWRVQFEETKKKNHNSLMNDHCLFHTKECASRRDAGVGERLAEHSGQSIRPKMLGKCAIVGNSDILLQKLRGPEIDSADTVIRVGHRRVKPGKHDTVSDMHPITPATSGYERYVGRRSSITWVSSFQEPRDKIQTDQEINQLNPDLPPVAESYVLPGFNLELGGQTHIDDIPFLAVHSSVMGRVKSLTSAMSQQHGGAGKTTFEFDAAMFFITSNLCTHISLYGFGETGGPRGYTRTYWASGPRGGLRGPYQAELKAFHYLMRSGDVCIYM